MMNKNITNGGIFMKKKLSILLIASLLLFVIAPNNNIEAKGKYKTYTHDKLFFSKKDLTGKKIKVKVFVSERMIFDGDTIFDNETTKFIKKNKIGRSYLHVKPKRKGNSYVSPANLNVYFPKKGKLKSSKMKVGRKYTIYGKVIEYSDNTWDGYNVVGIKITKIK